MIPEFPTGNGKIDLILEYKTKKYAVELKSFMDNYKYKKGIEQALSYGKQLKLDEIVLLVFVEQEEDEIKDLACEVDKEGVTAIVPLYAASLL